MADLQVTPAFGRRFIPDARDKRFPMRLALDPLRDLAFPHGIPPGARSYRPGPVLNQGRTGTCVAHGWTGKVHAGPVMQPMPLTPFDFYRLVVTLDEYDDNDSEATAADADLQSGTSVRAGAKAAQKLGLIKNYLWAESVDDMRAWHLVGKGGMVVGITWKSNMMQTDSDGFITFTGQNEGGHCVHTITWDDNRKHNGRIVRAAKIQQSWGLPWGDRGTGVAWMEEDDWAKAIQDDGEFCAATEIRYTPAAVVVQAA